MIAIVDYGIGNLGSAAKALRRAGARVELTGDPECLASAAALVLPGDGAFGAARRELAARGLDELIVDAAKLGRPILGICVGMQLLLETSDEGGEQIGLGVLPGRVRRFDGDVRVPHVGWNRLRFRRAHQIVDTVPDGSYVYFVHSFFCDVPEDLVVADCDYGGSFPAIVARGAVLGVQFHPEKSQTVGLRLVENFVAWAARTAGPGSGAAA